MSSSQQYQVSAAAALQARDSPAGQQEQFRLREENPYQILEQTDTSETTARPAEQQELVESVQAGGETHVYQILEAPASNSTSPPGQTEGERVEQTPVEYESFTPSVSTTHVYQALQPQKKDARDFYVNQPSHSDSGVYASVTASTVQNESFALTQQGGSTAPPHHRGSNGPYATKVDSLDKRGKVFNAALVCSALLILTLVMAISITALVLALTKGECQCQDENQELLARLDYLENLIGDGNDGITGVLLANVESNSDNIDSIKRQIANNELSISNNKFYIEQNTFGIDSLNESFAHRLEDLETEILKCNTAVEDTCTIPSQLIGQGECTTQVEYQKDGKTTVGFDCTSTANTMVAITRFDNIIECHCSGFSRATCSLIVTRCT